MPKQNMYEDSLKILNGNNKHLAGRILNAVWEYQTKNK